MNQQRISFRLIAKYVALQIPALLLLLVLLLATHPWLQFPAWVFWIAIALWVAKDFLMFPFVWRAYDPDFKGDSPHIGERGIVQRRLNPSGHIRVCGEIWQAELLGTAQQAQVGAAVRVRDIRGLILLVELEREEEKG